MNRLHLHLLCNKCLEQMSISLNVLADFVFPPQVLNRAVLSCRYDFHFQIFFQLKLIFTIKSLQTSNWPVEMCFVNSSLVKMSSFCFNHWQFLSPIKGLHHPTRIPSGVDIEIYWLFLNDLNASLFSIVQPRFNRIIDNDRIFIYFYFLMNLQVLSLRGATKACRPTGLGSGGTFYLK